jgi:hypothetical protein
MSQTQLLAETIHAVRPMVPAKNLELSRRFYADLGFQQRPLTDDLVEMSLGPCTFLLQNYYVKDWADNFVIHLTVSNIQEWWDHIASLDLPGRYGVKTSPPQNEDWGIVAGLMDPAGVLWRFAQIPYSSGR